MAKSGAQPSAEERRERLLDAADELFVHHSYGDVSIDDIAERAGVAHGLAFHYFESKRGLYVAMLQRRGTHNEQLFRANRESDPARWIRADLQLVFDLAARAPERFRSLVRNEVGAEVGEVMARRRESAADRILEKLAPTRESAPLRSAVESWVGYVTEFVAGWLDAGAQVSRPALAEVMISALDSLLQSVAEAQANPGFDPHRFALVRTGSRPAASAAA